MSSIETALSVANVDSNVSPASGQADGALPTASIPSVGFEQFLNQFRKYESVLVSVIHFLAETGNRCSSGSYGERNLRRKIQARGRHHWSMSVYDLALKILQRS